MGSALLCGLFLQILLTLTALVPTSDAQLTQSDINRIDTGLKLGREMATVFEKGTFSAVLEKVAANVGPFLGALGPALSLIFSFKPTQSAELEYMKKLKEHIDTRFDRLDFRFDEIERKIDWSVVNINFKQIERNILVMSHELEKLVKIPREGLNDQKSHFMNRYDNMFDESGKKLYFLCKTIGSSLMNYTKNDRTETNAFLRGVLQIVMEAVKIELTYYKVKGFNVVVAEHAERDWVAKISEITDIFQQIDGSVQSAYQSQCLEDTKEIVAFNSAKSKSNKDISILLYKELTRKYYWRDWMVVVYNPVTGDWYHDIKTCGGGHVFRFHNHNVVIASVDKSEPALDLARARKTLLGVYEFGSADRILDSIDTRCVCSTTIIRHYEESYWNARIDPSNLYANFPEKRGVYVPRNDFTLIMFG